MEYVLKNIEDNIVELWSSNEAPPKNARVLNSGEKWNGFSGESVNFYDENLDRKEDTLLIEEGLIKDNRGIWYSENKEYIEIEYVDEIPTEGWVKEKWKNDTDDLINGVWVDNIEKREKSEFNDLLLNSKMELEMTDRIIPRSVEDMYSVLTEEQKNVLPIETKNNIVDKQNKRATYLLLLEEATTRAT